MCEGETEQDFVYQVLLKHLEKRGIYGCAVLFGKQCKQDITTAPGGIFKYEPVRRHFSAALRAHTAQTSYVINDVWDLESLNKLDLNLCEYPARTLVSGLLGSKALKMTNIESEISRQANVSHKLSSLATTLKRFA